MDELETVLENMAHVRFEGRSYDAPLADLNLGEDSTDTDVRREVATYLGIPEQKLRSFAVDRNPDTNSITLRPEAVFGGV